MNKKYYQSWQIWPIFAAAIIIIIRLIVTPQFIETWYSYGIYTFFQSIFSLLSKVVFFCSVNEILIAICLGSYTWFVYKTYQRKQKFFSRILLNTIAILGIVYCIFNILWGFNYLRQPFHQHIVFCSSKLIFNIFNFSLDI